MYADHRHPHRRSCVRATLQTRIPPPKRSYTLCCLRPRASPKTADALPAFRYRAQAEAVAPTRTFLPVGRLKIPAEFASCSCAGGGLARRVGRKHRRSRAAVPDTPHPDAASQLARGAGPASPQHASVAAPEGCARLWQRRPPEVTCRPLTLLASIGQGAGQRRILFASTVRSPPEHWAQVRGRRNTGTPT